MNGWLWDNERLLSALEGQGRSGDLIIFFTAVAAAFAVASIMIVLVRNKLPEIGILKAMGATRRQILAVFTLQGTILSLLGGMIGTGLGVSIVTILSNLATQTTDDETTEPLFPFELSIELIIGTIVGAVVIGFIASLIPARSAADVDPIEVIHGG